MNKKNVFFLLLLFMSLCIADGGEMQKEKKENLRYLRYDETYSAVVSRFGEPDFDFGSGFLIVGYKLNHSIIKLNFFTGEGLQSVIEIFEDDKEVVLLPFQR